DLVDRRSLGHHGAAGQRIPYRRRPARTRRADPDPLRPGRVEHARAPLRAAGASHQHERRRDPGTASPHALPGSAGAHRSARGGRTPRPRQSPAGTADRLRRSRPARSGRRDLPHQHGLRTTNRSRRDPQRPPSRSRPKPRPRNPLHGRGGDREKGGRMKDAATHSLVLTPALPSRENTPSPNARRSVTRLVILGALLVTTVLACRSSSKPDPSDGLTLSLDAVPLLVKAADSLDVATIWATVLEYGEPV